MIPLRPNPSLSQPALASRVSARDPPIPPIPSPTACFPLDV